MARMTRTISVRIDEESMRALRLLEAQGRTRSEAIRTALHEAAAARRTRRALHAEAARLAADEDDRREMAAIAEELDEISEPW